MNMKFLGDILKELPGNLQEFYLKVSKNNIGAVKAESFSYLVEGIWDWLKISWEKYYVLNSCLVV